MRKLISFILMAMVIMLAVGSMTYAMNINSYPTYDLTVTKTETPDGLSKTFIIVEMWYIPVTPPLPLSPEKKVVMEYILTTYPEIGIGLVTSHLSMGFKNYKEAYDMVSNWDPTGPPYPTLNKKEFADTIGRKKAPSWLKFNYYKSRLKLSE